MQAENAFHKNGDKLKIGETDGFDVAAASYSGDASQNTLYTEWVELSPAYPHGCFELLWNGDPAADVDVECSLVGPAADTEVVVDSLDGTSYAGDLDAADPSLEDLGSRVIGLWGMTFNRVRMKITRSSGSGEYQARYRSVRA